MQPVSAFRIHHLNAVPEQSGAGLGLLIPVPGYKFRHRHFFLFRYWTDQMPDSPAFYKYLCWG
jgi:hypothetical protein